MWIQILSAASSVVCSHFCYSSAYRYPFYAVQWHPEKSNFEWVDKPGMVHSTHAVRASFYTAGFFVSEGKGRFRLLLCRLVSVTRAPSVSSKLTDSSSPEARSLLLPLFTLMKQSTLILLLQSAGDVPVNPR